MMVVHLEMAGADVDAAGFRVWIQREELLQDEEAVLEVGIGHLQPQLDVHVVVLVISDAEAVPLQHFAIGHPPVAQEHLRTFWEGVLTSDHLKGEVTRHVVDDLVPDSLCHVLAHLDLLCVLLWHFAHLSVASWLGAHASIAQSFLLDE